jgi:hypothetical protein
MLRFLVTALVIVGGGCDEANTDTSPSPVTEVAIGGRVMDYLTGAVMPGATVLFGETTVTADASGRYVLTVRPGGYSVKVNDVVVGSVGVHGAAFRGDLLYHSGTCISRYGIVADPASRRAIAGARISVAGRSVTTGPDGWYRIDLGCPAEVRFGNTTLMYISHPDYAPLERVVGRGVQGVYRIDTFLKRR